MKEQRKSRTLFKCRWGNEHWILLVTPSWFISHELRVATFKGPVSKVLSLFLQVCSWLSCHLPPLSSPVRRCLLIPSLSSVLRLRSICPLLVHVFPCLSPFLSPIPLPSRPLPSCPSQTPSLLPCCLNPPLPLKCLLLICQACSTRSSFWGKTLSEEAAVVTVLWGSSFTSMVPVSY